MKDFCPACDVEVDYDGSGQNAACSICGRTKDAAKLTVAGRKASAKSEKWKWILRALGVLALVAAFATATERTLGTLISTVVQVGGLVVAIWLFLKIREWNRRRKR
jgi:hypothetical protein